METSEIAPLVTAAAAVGTLIVAVIALSSRFVSKAIDRQGRQLEKYEKCNREEHAKLDRKVDEANKTLHDVHTLVVRLDERQQAAGGPKGGHAA